MLNLFTVKTYISWLYGTYMKLVLLVRSTVGATEWFTLNKPMISDLIYISSRLWWILRTPHQSIYLIRHRISFIDISNLSHIIAHISSSLWNTLYVLDVLFKYSSNDHSVHTTLHLLSGSRCWCYVFHLYFGN